MKVRRIFAAIFVGILLFSVFPFGAFSALAAGKSSELGSPTIKSVANCLTGVKITWGKVTQADCYDVYRSVFPKGGYKIVKSGVNTNSLVDTLVYSGKTYYYKVVARAGKRSSPMSKYQSVTYVEAPEITSRTNTASGIKIQWRKIPRATGYAVYRETAGGSWVRIKTVTNGKTVQLTDTAVKNNDGRQYRYTVRAICGKTMSAMNKIGRTAVRLTGQELKSAARLSLTSVKCSWSPSSRVTGYQVRFTPDTGAGITYTISNCKTATKTFTGLTSGKTYQVQIRSYKTVPGVGTFRSAWSKAQTVNLKKMVALTFDDGPGSYTGELLDIFAENGGKGTFFAVGNRMNSAKKTLKQMASDGHEIGLHGMDHQLLTGLSGTELKNQLLVPQKRLEEITGVKANLLRPPYGDSNRYLQSQCEEYGFALINWSVDTRDWESRNADAIYSAIMNRAYDGAIILCHDIHASTVSAMKRVIPALQKQGYELVTVTQLLTSQGGTVEAGKLYYSR